MNQMTYMKWATKVYQNVQKKRDQILAAPAHWLIGKGVTADMISLSRLILVVPMFYFVGVMPVVALLILIVNYYLLDAIDGVVARLSRKASLRGRAVDVSIDHFYVVPLVLALIYYNLTLPFWAAAYLVMQLIEHFANYLRHGVESGKYPFSYGKFVVYLVFLFWAIGGMNLFDYAFLFLAVYLTVKNIFIIRELYHGR